LAACTDSIAERRAGCIKILGARKEYPCFPPQEAPQFFVEHIHCPAASRPDRQSGQESKNMAKSVNKVILLGNVGKDPEIRSTGGGTQVANFTLATSDRFQDAQGNWQDRTEWHNLVAFKRLAEIVRDYVKKGSKLYIEGKIQTRSWDDKETGAKRYRTEIIVNDISLLSGRDNSSGGYSRSSSASNMDQRHPAGQDDFSQSTEISDEDIPF
jgi:single-strand DNA-binding protein